MNGAFNIDASILLLFRKLLEMNSLIVFINKRTSFTLVYCIKKRKPRKYALQHTQISTVKMYFNFSQNNAIKKKIQVYCIYFLQFVSMHFQKTSSLN